MSVVKATNQVSRKGQNSTPRHAKTLNQSLPKLARVTRSQMARGMQNFVSISLWLSAPLIRDFAVPVLSYFCSFVGFFNKATTYTFERMFTQIRLITSFRVRKCLLLSELCGKNASGKKRYFRVLHCLIFVVAHRKANWVQGFQKCGSFFSDDRSHDTANVQWPFHVMVIWLDWVTHNSGTDDRRILKKLVLPLDVWTLIYQTPPRSKGRRSRSQSQMKIVHKNIKYMPKTSSNSGNITRLVGNLGRRSEWFSERFDRKFLYSRFCACTVKICLKDA